MTAAEIAGKLAEHGILGIFVLILGYGLWKRDGELTAERKARLDDTKAYTETLLKVQRDATSLQDKLSDSVKDCLELKEALSKLKGPYR